VPNDEASSLATLCKQSLPRRVPAARLFIHEGKLEYN